MKVCVAIDSFKGSISSLEAGGAAKRGILAANPKSEVVIFPLADGGEGTTRALATGMNGRIESIIVKDPLGREITAEYGIVNGTTAVMEMAAAAGLPLLKEFERNPEITTTFGVGQMIKDAIDKGCRHFIVGIGGSATNDAGIGMLSALGVRFFDCKGFEVSPNCEGISQIRDIDISGIIPELKECSFRVACDVNNPLCGENGCSHIYAPQKGATHEQVLKMDKALSEYAELISKIIPDADSEYPGSGAAGGLGFGMMTFLNAKLLPGVDIILKEIKIEEAIKEADVVVTGEGRIDAQTTMGKAPSGVAKLAKKYNKRVIAFAGCLSEDAAECNKNGIDALFCIQQGAVSLNEAMGIDTALTNMERTVEQVFRLL